MNMSGRVVHFEIPFGEGDRARAFYREAFGWKMVDAPEMDYTHALTGPSGESGPSEIGSAAYFKDVEGNIMGLWQACEPPHKP